MNIEVHEHYIKIDKTPINEKELNITKCKFTFDEGMEGTKKAYFTLNQGNTYQQYIQNDECDIPAEVLANKGQLEIGVTVEEIENGTTITRFNPTPDYITTWEGSLKPAQNTEPITPTDKEQIEQMLTNINIDAQKSGKITTIVVTKKDGTTQEVTLEDGKSLEYNWQGTQLGIRQEGQSDYVYVDLKGEKGEPGAIKIIIVAELPSTGADDTIYLVPLETPDTQGNNYAEYIYINGAWELLGKIGVQVDLTDYYTKTETNNLLSGKQDTIDSSHKLDYSLISNTPTIPTKVSQLQNDSNFTTKSYVDGLVGDINSALDSINGEVI